MCHSFTTMWKYESHHHLKVLHLTVNHFFQSVLSCLEIGFEFKRLSISYDFVPKFNFFKNSKCWKWQCENILRNCQKILLAFFSIFHLWKLTEVIKVIFGKTLHFFTILVIRDFFLKFKTFAACYWRILGQTTWQHCHQYHWSSM